MKKLLWGALGFVGVLVVAAFAVPLLIDGNRFKPQLIAQARQLTGREIEITGPVKFALLPTPRLKIEGLRVGNLPLAHTPYMAEVRSADGSLSLLPLLRLHLEIAELTLFEPVIALELGPDGRGNWEFTRREEAATPPPAETPAGTDVPAKSRRMTIGIDRLKIVNGQVSWYDPSRTQPLQADRIDLELGIPGFSGPYAAKGSLQANGTAVAIDFRLGLKTDKGAPLVLGVAAPGGQLRFEGTVSELTSNGTARGHLEVKADNLATFVASLRNAAFQPSGELPAQLQQKFAFDAAIEVAAAGIVANDLRIALGEDSGQGNLTLALRAPRQVEGKLAFKHLDLDRWLAKSAARTPDTPAPPAPAGTAPTVQEALLPADLGIKLVLGVDELIWNGGTVRQLAVDMEADKGRVTLKKLDAQLPGDAILSARSSISADPAKPQVDGEFSLAGPKLRETLSWLKVDSSSVPAGKLGAFSIKGKLAAATAAIRVSEAQFRLDETTGRGSIEVGLSTKPSINLQVEADSFDADAYLPPRGSGGGAGAGKPASEATGPELKLKAKLAHLVWRGERMDGVDADLVLHGNRVVLGDSRIAAVAGASVGAKGSIANLGGSPVFDLVVNVNAADPVRLLKLIGAENILKGRAVGAVSVQGGIAGTANDLTLNGLAVSMLGAKAVATGKIAVAAAGSKYNFSRFELQTADSGKLLAGLGIGQRANLGAVAMNGAMAGDQDDVTFKGAATVRGLSANGTVAVQFGTAVPQIVADLTTGALDLDGMIGVQKGGSGSAAGGGSGGGRFSRTPIDLSALKAIDGTIRLRAAALSMTPWKLETADIEVGLKGGVLSVRKLAGRMFGGAVAATGTIDGAREVPSFGLKLSADNVDMGGVSRVLAGGNRFDGTMEADFDLTGAGASMADIMAHLNGSGKLGGNLRINASAREQMMGSVASVVSKKAGKFLEKQLGGAAGGGIRTEAVDLSTALQVVLERFANRNGPAKATLAIRNGVVTTSDLRLEGNNAYALTNATANLPAWTLESLTNIFLTEDPAQPCVIIRQQGALDSPNRSIDRGPTNCGKTASATPGQPAQPPQQQQSQPGQPAQPPQQQGQQLQPSSPEQPGSEAQPGQAQQPPQQQTPADQIRKKLKKLF